jgi:ribosomal protein S6--L-glutamate ligase
MGIIFLYMNIVILSRNKNLYSTKRLVEAAEQRGHSVQVIDHMKCVLITEQGRPHIYYNGKELTNVDAVIPRIGASATFYGTAVVRQFEMMKVFTAVESQALVRSRDKLRSLQILSRAGIGIPKTAFAYSPKEVDIDLLIDAVGGAPCVIKLLEGTQGIGVILAENKKAVKSVIEAFLKLDAQILVQEYIAESNGADIRAFVVDGQVVGAMMRQAKEGEFRSNLHRGGTASLITLTKEERETAIKAAKKLGLGIAGVDILRSKRGPLVIEVNSSPGLEGIETATKIDIAGKIIEYVERNEFNKPGE